jgi:hypothetical protein
VFRPKMVLAAAAVVGLLAPRTANADFKLTLTQGSDSFMLNINSQTAASGSGTAGSTAYSYSGFSYNAATQTFVLQDFRFGEYDLTNGKASYVEGGTNLPGNVIGSLNFEAFRVERINPGGQSNGPAGGNPSTPFTIALTASGYTVPAAPAQLTSQMAGVFNLPPSGQPPPNGVATLQSWVNVAGPDGVLGSSGNPLSFDVTQQGEAQSANMVSGVFSALSNPYSITHQITLSNMGYGVDSRFQEGSISSQVAYVTPVPPGLVLAATAAPFVGLLRRRMWRQAAVQQHATPLTL